MTKLKLIHLFCFLFAVNSLPSEELPIEFTIASFNVKGYSDGKTGYRKAKPPESRTRVEQIIGHWNPEILVIQEMGSRSMFHQFKSALNDRGSRYPYEVFAEGNDTENHIVVLSRFPIFKTSIHTDDSFELHGNRFRMSRPILELDIQVTENYSFKLLSVHLKSKRKILSADQQEVREKEARVLRRKIDDALSKNQHLNLVVIGDLNDSPQALSTRTILGKGRNRLFDTRPIEEGALLGNPSKTLTSSRILEIAWTYFYKKEDSYSRIDYILISRGMKAEWNPLKTFIPRSAYWNAASDHRMILAGFIIAGRR